MNLRLPRETDASIQAPYKRPMRCAVVRPPAVAAAGAGAGAAGCLVVEEDEREKGGGG